MRLVNGLVGLAVVNCTALFSLSAQRSLIGHWEGQMTREGSPVQIAFDFNVSDSSGGATTRALGVSATTTTFRGTFAAPSMRALGVPLRNVTVTDSIMEPALKRVMPIGSWPSTSPSMASPA